MKLCDIESTTENIEILRSEVTRLKLLDNSWIGDKGVIMLPNRGASKDHEIGRRAGLMDAYNGLLHIIVGLERQKDG